MDKLRISYIFVEIILLAILYYIALYMNIEADYYDEVGYISKAVSGFGIAILMTSLVMAKKTFSVVTLAGFILVWGINYTALDNGFRLLASNASAEDTLAASAKVIAMDTIPKDASFADRVDLRSDIMEMDSIVISDIINRVTQNNISALLTRRSINTGIDKLEDQINHPHIPFTRTNKEAIINDIEEKYIHFLFESKKLHNKIRGTKLPFKTTFNKELDEIVATGNDDPISAKIWLWYLVSMDLVDAKTLKAARTVPFSDMVDTLVIQSASVKTFNNSSVSFDTAGFSKFGAARSIGEDLYLLWMMTTLGIAIGLVSLILNILALIVRFKGA
jgi:hypothetical protein